MDKYEYKIRAEEIKALISEGDLAGAMKIADTIDWEHVRGVAMLCTISDVYKANRRYEDSKKVLLYAYDKHPTGRLIVYSLCELSIKLGELVEAQEYIKEFAQLSPQDPSIFILKYRLYEVLEASMEERISLLEEYKKREYKARWAYELAYMYHKEGLVTKCVEECDEMFLWFGEGKFVVKALELKALHAPLSEIQQQRYNMWTKGRVAEPVQDYVKENSDRQGAASGEVLVEPEAEDNLDITRMIGDLNPQVAPMMQPAEEEKKPVESELPSEVMTDVGMCNTLNLQALVAEGLQELSGPEAKKAAEILSGASDEEKSEDILDASTKVMPDLKKNGIDTVDKKVNLNEAILEDEPVVPKPPVNREPVSGSAVAPSDPKSDAVYGENVVLGLQGDELQEIPTGRMPFTAESFNNVKSPYDKVLTQEGDGQISLAVPEDEEPVEKQITGQMNLSEFMTDWEETIKNNEQKRLEDIKRRIKAHTGTLFADFDEATKSGLLEQMEKAFADAILRESGQPVAGISKTYSPDGTVELSASQQFAKFLADEDETDEDGVEELAEVEEHNTGYTADIMKAIEEDAEDDAKLKEQKKILKDEIEKEAAKRADSVDEETTDEEKPADTAEVESEEEKAESDQEIAKEKAETESVEADTKPETEEEQASGVRELSQQEEEIFAKFVKTKKTKRQLLNTLENISMASCTGNILITGEEGSGALDLAKGLVRELQYMDDNFSGKVAKITAKVLNKKDIQTTLERISGGALIIEDAGSLKNDTVTKLIKILDKDSMGLLVIMIDSKQKINGLAGEYDEIAELFNLRIDIDPLDDDALVAYGKEYAYELEYSIDEFGILALHTRIADMQTSDHDVSLEDVRDLIDEAIHYASKKNPKHFADILFAKRYDDEDMIILREKDFMHI